MKTSTLKSNLKTIKADAVAILIYQDKKIFEEQISGLKKYFPNEIDHIIKFESFKGKPETTVFTYTEKKINSPRLILVGVGEQGKTTLETFRKASAIASNKAKSMKAKHLSIIFPKLPVGFNPTIEETAQSIGEGAILSQYKFDKYITSKKEDEVKLNELTVCTEDEAKYKSISKGVGIARIICDGVILARNLANAPASEIYPETLAQAAKESSEKYGFKCSIWNEKKIKQEGFGGLMGVSSGSTRPPRFIILEYNSDKKEYNPIVLVGKGITFDSGGISIKPSAKMSEMKMDMSGAAAVIGTIEATARLKLPVRLIGLIPATENMPSGSAMKPGDIITHYGGKTSEVDNTDAEGRLILADALAYARSYNPAAVIDLATLTGAVVVALGHHATAVLGNDEELISKIKSAGEKTYERVWQLPMFDEYEKQIKSDIADVKNIGSRGAGTITAAMFLKKFISNKNKKEYKWAHLDIAGTAIMDEGSPYIPKGGSGVGVRLLTELLRNWK
ncbi:MAG: leucyl aminopeptidase [Bacteroidota bacterium]|nr:leucyl aminopeptidase [Bacteroidota bacterium]